MNQEYQIPTNSNQNIQQPSQSSVVSFGNSYVETNMHNPERVDQVSKRVFEIGQSLSDARSRYLDQNFPINNTNEKSIIKGALKRLLNKNQPLFKNESELKQEESRIGSTLFTASIAPGEAVHFFNDNPKSWFFYKETGIGTKEQKSFTIHYEVNDGGILRVSNLTGAKGEYISGQELVNFTTATELYQQQVFARIYGGGQTSNFVQ